MTDPRLVLVLATVVVAGALVGSGLSTLTAARLMPLRSRVPPLPEAAAPLERGDATVAIEALLEEPGPPPGEPPRPPSPDEACAEGLELVGLFIDRRHPARSVAALRTAAGARAVRLGGRAEGWLLTGVAPRSVTLEQSGARCELRYGRRATRPAEAGRARTSAGEVAPEDAEPRIQEIAPGRFVVERSLARELSTSPPAIRAIPALEDGQMRGVRLYGIRRSSIAGQLGLRNGDTLRSIDGAAIEGASGALEAYGRLLRGEPVRVGLLRRGAPVTLEVRVSP